MSDLKQKQHQLREGIILETAYKMLLEQGYSAMNMDELAAQVGISKATLYQHFSSKEEVAIQVIMHSMHASETFFEQLNPNMSPLIRLEKMLRYAIQKRFHTVTIRASTFPSHMREDPRIQGNHDRFTSELTALVNAGKADGSIRGELATEVIIRMYFSFYTMHYYDLLKDGVVSEDVLVETLVSIFINGISTAPHVISVQRPEDSKTR